MNPHHGGMARCRGARCRAPIRWHETEAGKKMCLDAAPVDRSEAARDDRAIYFLDDEDRAVKWTSALAAVDVGELYRSHWATCPDREDFRT